MRIGIAMIIGAICMFALGSGLHFAEKDDSSSTDRRRVKIAGEIADAGLPDPRGIDRTSAGFSRHFDRLMTEKHSRDEAVQVAWQEPDGSLMETWQQLRRIQFELDRVKAPLEAKLMTGVAMASAELPIREPQTPTPAPVSDETRTRVLTEVYRSMSTDSVAAIVGDLLDTKQTSSAMSVLQILDDRKAARVLAELAGPRPDVAMQLAEQLAQSRIR